MDMDKIMCHLYLLTDQSLARKQSSMLRGCSHREEMSERTIFPHPHMLGNGKSLGYQGILTAFVLSSTINIKSSDSQMVLYLHKHISAYTLPLQEHLCSLIE